MSDAFSRDTTRLSKLNKQALLMNLRITDTESFSKKDVWGTEILSKSYYGDHIELLRSVPDRLSGPMICWSQSRYDSCAVL